MAIFLTTPTQSLVAAASAPAAVTESSFSAHYRIISDRGKISETHRLAHGQLNGTSEVVLIAPPDGGTIYAFIIEELTIYNNDTDPITIAVMSKDIASLVPFHKEWQGTLQSGEYVSLSNQGDWNIYTSDGLIKSSSGGAGGSSMTIRDDTTLITSSASELDFFYGLVAASVGPGVVRIDLDYLAPGGENGTSTQPARSDHVHDTRYYTQTILGSVLAGQGASLIGIQDLGGYYTSANVEAALQEIGLEITNIQNDLSALTDSFDNFVLDLASTDPGKGASMVGIEDAGNKFDATNVEDALQELVMESVTESYHRTIDQLVHDIAEDSYTEFLYSGVQVTDAIIWTDNTKVKKIRETHFVYTGNQVTEAVTKQYDSGGLLVETYTEDFNYTGQQLDSIDGDLS